MDYLSYPPMSVGVPYIVRDGESALLIEPNDARAMADAVLRLAADARLQDRLRSRGLQEVAGYSWPQVGPQWLSLYDQCQGAAS